MLGTARSVNPGTAFTCGIAVVVVSAAAPDFAATVTLAGIVLVTLHHES